MLITRGSINDVVGHTQNIAVRNSLFGIKQSVLSWEYLGWMDVKSDVNGNRKHPEAAYFTYYEVKIGGKTYYANVKMHKHYGKETLYCIRDKCDIASLNMTEPPII